ncbi:MAG: glycosyltransferase family 2 protein [Clostridia bacterium]|nr:glycosyltransferase family 2 protein [Clostridia bacterium]
MNKMIEVIIVDDCSTENYSEIYNEFLNLNLTILRPEKNSGPGVCRHMGVDKAVGKYITFIDSDDRFIDSTALQRLYAEAISKPTMDMICG